MDLCKLRTFRTVGVLLNFNKAATALNCAQSTVSAQIKALEQEVGELLFRRVHKKVVLTEAGEKMLYYANKLLSIEEEALASITDTTNPAGTIKLMVPEAIAAHYFPGLIQQFLLSCPAIHFEVSNCSQSGLENELRTESVDLAFLFSESFDSSNLHSEIILKEPFVVVANPANPLTRKQTIDTSDLHAQTIFLPKAGCGHGLLLRQLLGMDRAAPASIVELTSIEAIKQSIIQGPGIAVLPGISVQRELRGKHITALNWIDPITIAVAMVWHKERKLPQVLQDFMHLVRTLAGH